MMSGYDLSDAPASASGQSPRVSYEAGCGEFVLYIFSPEFIISQHGCNRYVRSESFSGLLYVSE